MKPYAESFYSSQQWKDTRVNYAKYVGGLCERCLERGEYSPGEIVHHKIHITSKNINDTSITLNFDNLVLLCRKCHGEVHGQKKIKRFSVLPDGTIAPHSEK